MTESGVAGVIFDLDGVLVCTDEFHFAAWERLAREESLYFTKALYDQRMRGVGRMICLDNMLDGSRPGGAAACSETEKEALAEKKNQYYRRDVRTLTPDDLVPGTREMLRELRRRGIKIAVGSSSCNAPLIMGQLRITGEFDAVADGNDITQTKPDPEVFLLAAERVNLDPSTCLVVEDAPFGIEAARRAGMAVFGIGTPETLKGVEHLAPSLAHVTVDELLAAARETATLVSS